MKVIGISAHAARSGKDTFAKCLQIILLEKGYKVAIRSLASPLKVSLEKFVMENFSIDINNCTDEEKNLIRPLLVAYGGAKRKQTKGRFWTNLMQAEISNLKQKGYDYVIIPDIRYSEYGGDEVDWLKKENSGSLFYLKLQKEDGSYVEPPNDDEARNSPLLEGAADYKIVWPNLSFAECLFFAKRTFHEYEKSIR